MMDIALLKRANPLLFTTERYDEYPTDPEELLQLLSSEANSDLSARERPFTELDQLDFLLYRDSVTGELDVHKKLACEYALYHAERIRRHRGGDHHGEKHVGFQDLKDSKTGSDEWFTRLVTLLSEISGDKMDLSQLEKTAVHQTRPGDASNRQGVARDQQDALHELTSYMLSSSIKNGIHIRPSDNVDDPVKFLKNGIESLIESASTANTNTNSTDERDATETKLAELTTAFKDLQLAHSFLTKQFENDHTDHMRDIEKLTRTNRELQEKLLNYHSNLSKIEKKLKDNEHELRHSRARDEVAGNHSIALDSPGKMASTPNLNHESMWGVHTADQNETLGATPGSPSLSIMKNEFKRLLTETQRKYEREIGQEREIRRQLEKELKSLQ
ncbi:Pea2p KNAG_0G01640 [Huiozyma naganishii CBS 8797]|uniref:Uncharacterized protein n=1 Tax=Huiozyma naganishii (strain ATCC MYA-139 / BCRC 22969 / CBS 8797 / KCTC 17520 / NBRC 10181 / NCYC 3082 / Yp74L-3) TaxID=1071383 RepID=J7S0Y9_HUIN7|nr:hypothetical protein KNAG_0G01640 [Kazachstania naganishii CBS 8797]CCK71222.1 hypothetical protein KNAG_0G01640 [Kazachstania naganishii CBS 8797]